MAQTLEDQINTIERALGERMIAHALVIVRAWLSELGENNPYEQAFQTIQERYNALFNRWISGDDADTDAQMDAMTGEMYQLSDAVYADIRIQRGLSPNMRGFNPMHMQSVVNYFSNCLKLREEDYQWFAQALNDSNQAAVGLLALSSLAKNLRDCFSLTPLMHLIDGFKAENDLAAEQCMAYTYCLLIHYDVRIDFFPQLQKHFVDTLHDVDPEGDRAFSVLCALVRSTDPKWLSKDADEEKQSIVDQLPDDVKDMLSTLNSRSDELSISTWLPKSEHEYMQGLVAMFPDTWLYSVLIGDNEERESELAVTYLSVGRMDMMWDRPKIAEKYLVKWLRVGEKNPLHYLNYGHCLLLRGDRIMAYENYRIARQLCKGPKDFFNLFRPDRGALVDHGVPVEQVYLIEDRLLKGDA